MYWPHRVGHSCCLASASSHFMLAAPTLASGVYRACCSRNAGLAFATAGEDRTVKFWALGALLARLPSPRPGRRTAREAGQNALGTGPLFRPLTSAAVVAHRRRHQLDCCLSKRRFLGHWKPGQDGPLVGSSGVCFRLRRSGDTRACVIWAVAFSGTDRVLASASGDRTVRLWKMPPRVGLSKS